MLQDIKKTLWSTADKLRANVDAAEYKHIALGLIFLKFISDSFSSRQAELRKRLADSNDELYVTVHSTPSSSPNPRAIT